MLPPPYPQGHRLGDDPMRVRRSSGSARPWIISLSFLFLVLGFVTGYTLRSSAPPTLLTLFDGEDNPLLIDGALASDFASSVAGVVAPVSILILGSDSRPGEGGAPRTDVIMVLSIQPEAKRVVLVSIPRDLWVSIPGYGEGRINTAFHYGELNGYPGGGVALVRETVEGLLGITLSHSVHIDFRGFVRLVDLLGGVDIEVAQDIWDPLFPDEGYGYEPLYIPAGRQHMDGEMLLQYVRTRYGGNDFDRIRRQQQALMALGERALSLDLIPRLPDLVGTALNMVDTDLSPRDILALALVGKDIGLGGIEMRAIDQAMTLQYVTSDGAQVLLPDQEKIRVFLAELLSPQEAAAGE